MMMIISKARYFEPTPTVTAMSAAAQLRKFIHYPLLLLNQSYKLLSFELQASLVLLSYDQ